jgi:hypothetical protein
MIGLLTLLLGPIAWRLGGHTLADLHGKDRADAINSARQTLLAAAGGTAALTGLAFTARTFYLSRRGQLTDRYTKAIGLLASDNLTERLGGIYALEHLMIESPRDHNTVVEVLAAFIRDRCPAEPSEEIKFGPPPTDVQTAMTILGRRPPRSERNLLDLTRTNLAGVVLPRVQLTLTYLRRNRVQHELAETYGVSQSTISRAIAAITPALGSALAAYVPTADDLDSGTQYVVDGTMLRAGRGPRTRSCTPGSTRPPA